MVLRWRHDPSPPACRARLAAAHRRIGAAASPGRDAAGPLGALARRQPGAGRAGPAGWRRCAPVDAPAGFAGCRQRGSHALSLAAVGCQCRRGARQRHARRGAAIRHPAGARAGVSRAGQAASVGGGWPPWRSADGRRRRLAPLVHRLHQRAGGDGPGRAGGRRRNPLDRHGHPRRPSAARMARGDRRRPRGVPRPAALCRRRHRGGGGLPPLGAAGCGGAAALPRAGRR